LNALVRQGKVRYIGCSNYLAWEVVEALWIARQRDLQAFVSCQDFYNLLYREEEREMLPLCHDQQIAVIPWSPLAREAARAAARDWRCGGRGDRRGVAGACAIVLAVRGFAHDLDLARANRRPPPNSRQRPAR